MSDKSPLKRNSLLLTPTTQEQVRDLSKFNERMEKYPNGTTIPNLATQLSLYQESTSSPEDSPASLFQQLEIGTEPKTTATSGHRCIDLYENYLPLGSLLRTLLDSFQWTMAEHLRTYALTWRVKGTKFNRLCFQLQVLGRGTDAIDSSSSVDLKAGLLPTPNTMDHLKPKTGQAAQKIAATHRKGRTAPSNLREFLTPEAHQAYRDEPTLAPSHACETKKDQWLNPEFDEWLMGFPIGWTAIQNHSSPSEDPDTSNVSTS